MNKGTSKESAQAVVDLSESKSKESYNPFLKDEIGAGVAIDSWLKENRIRALRATSQKLHDS